MLGLEVFFSDPVVVETPEEFSYIRLTPYGLALELVHHKGEPGTPGLRVAEYPDDVLWSDAAIPDAVTALRKPFSFGARGI
jgi:hypothetical protein